MPSASPRLSALLAPCFLVLTALPAAAQIEIISWVPPYAIEEARAAAEANFGACDVADGLTRVGLQFWVPNPDGTIKYADHEWYTPVDADVAWWRTWCDDNGVECLLTVYNNVGTWDWSLARSAFADNAATFVGALVDEMDRHALDGIDLDLEGIGALNADRAAYAAFVANLSAELRARGKTLTIDSFHYIWNAPNHDWWPDWVGQVDNIHAMGYDDLFEGGTSYQPYSFQQRAGLDAGHAATVVSMGMPSWLGSWGVSSGRGTSALAHVQEVRLDLPTATGIAVWDLQLAAWQDSALWCEIAALRGGGGPAPTAAIVLDQIGYVADRAKGAVIREPEAGFDGPAPLGWVPGDIEIRRVSDDGVAMVAPATPWRAGAVHSQSGDRTWSVDFSALVEPGSYYLWSEDGGVTSVPFEIDPGAYAAALRHAGRAFFYQRCGTPRGSAHGGAAWADESPCHVGPDQDVACRPVGDPTGDPLDLSGGWHDAGDYGKYVNYADGALHDLLAAYEESPAAFGDDWSIPESGNGVADLLDEAWWELSWLLAMQQPSGGVLHKVSVTDWSAASPPSADAGPRRHGPITTSATVSACGAFAHAAAVFRSVGLPLTEARAATLEAAARRAWDYLQANPGWSSYDGAGFANGAVKEDTHEEQASNLTCAAAYLHALTGEAAYRDAVDATYADVHLVAWRFAYPFETEYQDCLLAYAASPGATPAVATAIRDAYTTSMLGADNLQHVVDGDDPYGAYLPDASHVWGSNRVKAHQGLMYLQVARHGLDPGREAVHRDAALGYLHYLHGRNPLGLAFPSRFGPAGAERSTHEIYHSWFGDGTPWDRNPPPGILPGGVNPSFAPDPAYTGPPLEPPEGQPILKSYRDWNTGWPENSWQVTENHVPYQAAYVRLLANFVGAEAPSPPVIREQPSASDACEGDAVTLRVVARGVEPLRYAWRRDGVPLPEAPPYSGTTGPTLTVTSVSVAEAGRHDVVVTDDLGASTISAPGELAVFPATPPVAATLRVARTGNAADLSWQPVAGATEYAVLTCDATLGDCEPVAVAATMGPPFRVEEDAARVTWMRVETAGPCPGP